mmetsp:Transcript_45924/g.60872  ORF Transcript_45924/g.60872 Transcript_45924/m.60872 type:complete len:166 (-) Transcript_45924:1484-1981(-)
MQDELIKHLFGPMLIDFNEFFDGFESQFVNNLIVMMSYSHFDHGQIIQAAKYESSEVYFVSQGGVAVCEATCFTEPILIYTKGAAINLYQILMNRRLPFSFIAASNDCYTARTDLLTEEIHVNYSQKEIERFRASEALKRNNQQPLYKYKMQIERRRRKPEEGGC